MSSSIQIKLAALLSSVRFQNVTALLIAQLLTAKFLFEPGRSFKEILWQQRFIYMLLATSFAIAAGYIINNFYNRKRDLINRPHLTVLESNVSTGNKLYLYFILNALSVISASMISLKAVLFFSVYLLLIWLYSHKWQKKAFIHEISVSLLILYPFFGLMLFFKKADTLIISGGWLFFLTLLIKEFIKNHLTIKGDVAGNIQTALTKLNEKAYKRLLTGLFTLLIPSILFILKQTPFRFVQYYLLFYVFLMSAVYVFYRKKNYKPAYMTIKLAIATGILSVIFIK